MATTCLATTTLEPPPNITNSTQISTVPPIIATTAPTTKRSGELQAGVALGVLASNALAALGGLGHWPLKVLEKPPIVLERLIIGSLILGASASAVGYFIGAVSSAFIRALA